MVQLCQRARMAARRVGFGAAVAPTAPGPRAAALFCATAQSRGQRDPFYYHNYYCSRSYCHSPLSSNGKRSSNRNAPILVAQKRPFSSSRSSGCMFGTPLALRTVSSRILTGAVANSSRRFIPDQSIVSARTFISASAKAIMSGILTHFHRHEMN